MIRHRSRCDRGRAGVRPADPPEPSVRISALLSCPAAEPRGRGSRVGTGGLALQQWAAPCGYNSS